MVYYLRPMDPCSTFTLLSYRTIKSSKDLTCDELYIKNKFELVGTITIMTWWWGNFKILDMSTPVFGVIAINGEPYMYNSYDRLVYVDPRDRLHFGTHVDYYAALRLHIRGSNCDNKFLDEQCKLYFETSQGQKALELISS